MNEQTAHLALYDGLADWEAGHLLAELHTDVELGADRDAVIRVMINNRPDGIARMAGQRVFVGDPASAGPIIGVPVLPLAAAPATGRSRRWTPATRSPTTRSASAPSSPSAARRRRPRPRSTSASTSA